MEEFYKTVALISCGVSLAMGSVYLYLGVLRRSSTFLLFGSIGIALFIFYILPPVGFILHDTPPYDSGLLFKRIFIFLYYGATPWFILAYSGYPRKWTGYVLSALAACCYVIMYFTPESIDKPFWSQFALLNFGGIFLLGIAGARWLYVHGRRSAAWPLYSVMIAYLGIFLMTAINQLTDGVLGNFFNLKLFFPIHFHSLFFMLVMGHHLVLDLFEKFNLEEHLRQSEARWKSFMHNTSFLTVELDLEGNILFINDYASRLLGQCDAAEITGVNWFTRFVPDAERESRARAYQLRVTGHTHTGEESRSTVVNFQGDTLVVSWSSFLIRDTAGNVQHVMNIGKNVTDEDSVNKLVEQLKNELLKEQLPALHKVHFSDAEIIGSSQALTYALQKANQVAVTHAPVLLEGETGVGKDLFANLIHNNSSRSKKAFIKVNCAALPKDLIEDELFGHEKGAFTSAVQVRKGRFELADGGTLFLDEIGELPLAMQPKLLRVLQSGEFERIGGQKTIKVDVRILAATNRNMAAEVQNMNFRSDLFYRLNVFPITIPSLRQRKEDLPTLIHYFIARKARKYNKSFDQVSHASMQRLLDYDWPGNIRELKNVIERSVIVNDGPTIRFDWWDAEGIAHGGNNDNRLERIERDHIIAMMEKCNWKINGENGAAEMLAMNPNTLRSKMKRLGIRRPTAH